MIQIPLNELFENCHPSSHPSPGLPDLEQPHAASPRARPLLRRPAAGSVLSLGRPRLILRSASGESSDGLSAGPTLLADPGPTRTGRMQAGPQATLKQSEDSPEAERSTRRRRPRPRTEPAEGRRRSRNASGDAACDHSRSGHPGLGCEYGPGVTFFLPNSSFDAGFK